MTSHAERFAKQELGRHILTPSTGRETRGRQFYLDVGWTEFGICPDYAMRADGQMGDACFFCKKP
jgi:hypothetical protein